MHIPLHLSESLDRSWVSRHLGSGWLAFPFDVVILFTELECGVYRACLLSFLFFPRCALSLSSLFFWFVLLFLIASDWEVGLRVRFAWLWLSLLLLTLARTHCRCLLIYHPWKAVDSWRKWRSEEDGLGAGTLRNLVLYSLELGHLEVSSCSMKWSKHCPLWNLPRRLPGTNGSHPKPIAALTGKLASSAWDYSSLLRPWCHNSEAAACLGGCRKLCRFSLCVLQGSSGQVPVWWLLWKNISSLFWGSSWPTTTIPQMRNSDQVSTDVSNFGGMDLKAQGWLECFWGSKMSSWSPDLLGKRGPEGETVFL